MLVLVLVRLLVRAGADTSRCGHALELGREWVGQRVSCRERRGVSQTLRRESRVASVVVCRKPCVVRVGSRAWCRDAIIARPGQAGRLSTAWPDPWEAGGINGHSCCRPYWEPAPHDTQIRLSAACFRLGMLMKSLLNVQRNTYAVRFDTRRWFFRIGRM